MGCYLVSEESHSEPSQTIKMEVFAKIVDSFLPLTLSAKSSILDSSLGSEYALAIYYYIDCRLNMREASTFSYSAHLQEYNH